MSNRTLKDLLEWGEHCNDRYRDTELICIRNEHQNDTKHRALNGKEWDDRDSGGKVYD